MSLSGWLADGWLVAHEASREEIACSCLKHRSLISPAKQYPQARGIEEMRILIVVEETGTGYSAYSPDVPGCAATGQTRQEVEQTMQDAIALHLDPLRESGENVPPPKSYATYVEVAA